MSLFRTREARSFRARQVRAIALRRRQENQKEWDALIAKDDYFKYGGESVLLTACISIQADIARVDIRKLSGESMLEKSFNLEDSLQRLAVEIGSALYGPRSHVAFFADDGTQVFKLPLQGGRDALIRNHTRLTVKEDHFERFAQANDVETHGNMAHAFYNAAYWKASAAKTDAIERIRSWTSASFENNVAWQSYCDRCGKLQHNPNRMLLCSLDSFIAHFVDPGFVPRETWESRNR